MRLLLIEDNAKLAGLIARLLRENGLAVDAVGTADEAATALRLATYDLVLLDLALPDGDGHDLLLDLRRAGDTVPVLVATARADLLHRVQVLNGGADDYLVKPFSLDELLARIRALLRRPKELRPATATLANLSLDTESPQATVDGAAIDLSRGEARVLCLLLQHQGQLLPRERLEQALYSFDQAVTGNAMEATVSRLRRRLDAAGAQVSITAMRGLGYLLRPRPPCP